MRGVVLALVRELAMGLRKVRRKPSPIQFGERARGGERIARHQLARMRVSEDRLARAISRRAGYAGMPGWHPGSAGRPSRAARHREAPPRVH